jgi:hypothetical protein
LKKRAFSRLGVDGIGLFGLDLGRRPTAAAMTGLRASGKGMVEPPGKADQIPAQHEKAEFGARQAGDDFRGLVVPEQILGNGLEPRRARPLGTPVK